MHRLSLMKTLGLQLTLPLYFDTSCPLALQLVMGFLLCEQRLWYCVSKISPARVFSALFASESQCRCWQNGNACLVIWADGHGVSKEIHDQSTTRELGSDWPELAHLVHWVLFFVHCNVQCLEQFLSHTSEEIQVISYRLLLLLLALADHLN